MFSTAASSEKRINGFAVRSVRKVIDAFTRRPSLAAFEFKARTIWLDGGHTRSMIKDFRISGRKQSGRSMPFVVETDLPQSLAGHDRAISPLEQLLVALNACLTTTIVAQAATRSIHVDSLELRSQGKTDLLGFLGIEKANHRGPSKIHTKLLIEADCPESGLYELVSESIAVSQVYWLINSRVSIRVDCNGRPVV